MSLLSRMRLWAGMKALGISETSYSLSDPALGQAWQKLSDQPSHGRAINESSALQLAPVFTCVRILAETNGALPKAVFRDDGNGNATKVDHPVAEVLVGSPNADMTSQEFFEAGVANLAMRGNAYSEVQVNGAGNLSSVTPLPAAQVTPLRRPNGDIVFDYWDRGKKETLPAEKIWHVKGFGTNGLIGLSPIGAARQVFGQALTLDEFASTYFANGARMSGLFKIPQWLKDDQRLKARKVIEEKYIGADKAGTFGLLEGGMEFQALSVPPEDAQFLQTRQFGARQIYGIFRMPPHLAGDLERATFTNIEQQSQDFVQLTLLPYLVRFEQSANKRLFKAADRGKFYLRFNVEGLLRADSAARAALYSVLLQNGVYNRNEVRALENRPRSDAPGMNDYTVQTNMALIQFLEAINRASGAQGAAKP